MPVVVNELEILAEPPRSEAGAPAPAPQAVPGPEEIAALLARRARRAARLKAD